MATFSEIENAFTARMESLWLTTPIAWPNINYKPTPGISWIRCSVITFPTQNSALGVSVINRGLFWVQIFTPLNKGTGEANQLVDQLVTILANTQFNGIYCHAADVQRVGDDGRGWFQTNFRVPYWSHQRG